MNSLNSVVVEASVSELRQLWFAQIFYEKVANDETCRTTQSFWFFDAADGNLH